VDANIATSANLQYGRRTVDTAQDHTRQMRVSVVIASYNIEDFIVSAVESMLQQSFGDLNVIVVDDASTDQTWVRLQTIQDERLITHRLPVHCGISTARNIGAQLAADSEFIAVMDGDDISVADRIERQVRFLETNPAIHIVGGQIEFFQDSLSNSIGRPKHPLTDDVIKARLVLINGTALVHPTTLVRTRFLQRNHLAYPPPVRGVIGEDHDLWISMIPYGVRFAALPDLLLYKRRHKTNVARRTNEAGRLATLKTVSRARFISTVYPSLNRVEAYHLAVLFEEHKQLGAAQLAQSHAMVKKVAPLQQSVFGENKKLLAQLFVRAFEDKKRLKENSE